MLERFTPERVLRRANREAWQLAHIMSELPYQVHDTLEQVRDGQIEVGFVHKGLDDFLEQIQKVFNRLVIALIVAGGLIGSAMIGVFSTSGPQLLGINAISVIGFALSTVLAVWLFWSIFRSGRL